MPQTKPRSPSLKLALWLALAALAPAVAQAEPPAQQAPCVETTQPLRVNVNTATAEQLEQLPRIGPARAQAILRLREHLGGFKRISQLLRVKGIGRATLRGLLPHIRLSDPPEKAPEGATEGTSGPDPVG